MCHEPAAAAKATAAADALLLHEVRFGWQADHVLLEIPLLRLARGERVFLEGPSGSGKSTLLGLISGVLEPQSGSIEVLGRDFTTLGRRQRDRFRGDHIGYVFQMFNLIPYLSALENVTLAGLFSPRRCAAARVHGSEAEEGRRLLAALGFDGKRLALAARELSHGQQQRVAAARALFGRPELLICDEPTSSLDAALQERFLELLMRECASVAATLVFASHDASLAGQFDRRVSMRSLNRLQQNVTPPPLGLARSC